MRPVVIKYILGEYVKKKNIPGVTLINLCAPERDGVQGRETTTTKNHTVCVYVAQCRAGIYSLQQRCNEGQTQTASQTASVCVRAHFSHSNLSLKAKQQNLSK